VSFTHFKDLKSSIEFTIDNSGAIFDFEGSRDRQPNLENYFLSIDKAKFGLVSGKNIKGAQGSVAGDCHMLLNKEGNEFYEIKCDVFDRKRPVWNSISISQILQVLRVMVEKPYLVEGK
jgi:hypothetical protein